MRAMDASGGGGGFDLGTGGSVDVSAYSGAFSYSYPIKVPEGRGDVYPKLTLGYTSTGGNGWIGRGWAIALGSIQRSTKFGVPDYDDDDTFVLNFVGAAFTLVDVGGNEFRLKNDLLIQRIIPVGDLLNQQFGSLLPD